MYIELFFSSIIASIYRRQVTSLIKIPFYSHQYVVLKYVPEKFVFFYGLFYDAVSYSIKCLDDLWVLNWKEFQMNYSFYNRGSVTLVLCLPGGIERTTTWIKRTGALAEIRRGDLPITNLNSVTWTQSLSMQSQTLEWKNKLVCCLNHGNSDS
jgi:hypothetical protein